MKYVGSKARIKKSILPIIQKYIDDNSIELYIEPFCGGCNIIDDIKCKHKVANDNDKYLMALLKQAQKDVSVFNTLPNLPTREHYYDVRDNKEKYEDWYIGAILFFASYNARVYGGCYGAYAKTKDGKIRNYFQEALKNLKQQAAKFKDIHFTNTDYKQAFLQITDKKLIYCDPPYKNGIGYKNNFNHDDFWEWIRKQDSIVIISENEAPSDFVCIWEQELNYTMNNRDNKKIKNEKLFIHKKWLWEKV